MSLSSGEHVIYTTRFSKKLFFGPLLLSAVALVGAFVSRMFGAAYAHYLFWTFVAAAILLLVPPLARYLSSQFVVTNERVIIRRGFLARTTYEMVLSKIESIAVNQSLADRFIWGSGTLVITGTGGTKEEFPNVGGAAAFQEHLNEALHSS